MVIKSNIYLHPTACRLHILRRLERATGRTAVFEGHHATLVPTLRNIRNRQRSTVHQLPNAG